MDHGMDDLSAIAQNVKKESTREQFSYRRDHRRVVRCMLNPALSRVSARHQGVQPGAKIAEDSLWLTSYCITQFLPLGRALAVS